MAYGDNIERIPLSEMIYGHLYRLRSRNLACGVYDGNQGFIGIREKLGSIFLDRESHWDQGAPYGTAHPQEDLGPLPRHIQVRDRYDAVDRKTGRLVDFGIGDPDQITTGCWFFVDTGERSKDIHPLTILYRPLFDWLLQAEVEHDLLHDQAVADRLQILKALENGPMSMSDLVGLIDRRHRENARSSFQAIMCVKRLTLEGKLEVAQRVEDELATVYNLAH